MKGAGAGQAMDAGGSAMQGVGSIVGGLAANEAGKYTRKIMNINAHNVQNDGVEQVSRIREAARLAMGRQLVSQGGSGFQTGTGSAIDALKESAIEREIDIATTRKQAQGQANAYGQQGQQARAQGKSAMIGGFISGAASFMQAAASGFGG